jgi:hypothetical protein
VSQRDFAGARWIKSSRSNTQDACVEVARVDTTIGVRDSKKGDASPILEFASAELATFIAGAKAGGFDPLI